MAKSGDDYCFSSRAKKLSVKFNRAIKALRNDNIQTISEQIYHYTSSAIGSGILLNIQDSYNRLWFKYFMKTPFFDEDSIGRLYSGFQQMYVDRQNFATYLTAMMSGKTRIFFITPQTLEGVKNIFGVQDNEEIILAENEKSLKRLIKTARNKVIFISPDIYQQCREILLQAGLIENRDFINIINFLSDAHGVPFNSFALINAM